MLEKLSRPSKRYAYYCPSDDPPVADPEVNLLNRTVKINSPYYEEFTETLSEYYFI